MPTGRYHTIGCNVIPSAVLALVFCFTFVFVPYNKQLNNLDRSVVTGKSQTSTYRIDLVITRSLRRGLSLRYSRNDLTLGYEVVIIDSVYSLETPYSASQDHTTMNAREFGDSGWA